MSSSTIKQKTPDNTTSSSGTLNTSGQDPTKLVDGSVTPSPLQNSNVKISEITSSTSPVKGTKTKEANKQVAETSNTFENRLKELHEEVEDLIAHKLMENMKKVSNLLKSLNIPENWKRDFSSVKFEHTISQEQGPAQDDKKDEGPTKEADKKEEDKKPVEQPEKKPEKTLKVPANKKILALIEAMDPCITDFETVFETILPWLELQKKQHQTGNSFGNDVIDEVIRLVRSYYHLTGMKTKEYFETRAKLCQELEKNSGIEDAFIAVDIQDYNYAHDLNSLLKDLEKVYLIIYDVCSKNWKMINLSEDKILKRQNSHSSQHMY